MSLLSSLCNSVRGLLLSVPSFGTSTQEAPSTNHDHEDSHASLSDSSSTTTPSPTHQQQPSRMKTHAGAKDLKTKQRKAKSAATTSDSHAKNKKKKEEDENAVKKKKKKTPSTAAAAVSALDEPHTPPQQRRGGYASTSASSGCASLSSSDEDGEEAVPETLPPEFMCPVCLDMLTEPLMPPCGHAFCEGCILTANAMGKQECPICRAGYTEATLAPCSAIKRQMARCVAPMRCACGEVMAVRKYRKHSQVCGKVQEVSPMKFKPLAKTKAAPPPAAPNRVTFKCPLCPTSNLDMEGLRAHVKSTHPRAGSAVCPICVSMPWGDPSYATSNFVRHLENRHKYDVSSFVDFGQDEEAMVRLALEASMRDA